MSTEYIIGLLLLGFVAGFMSSMVGIGGGIVIVPALVFLFALDQKTAQGTSLLMLALPVAAVGAYTYYRNGNLNWQASLILAGTFMIGGYLGGKLVNSLDTTVIKKIFAIFMILIAIKYLFFDNDTPKNIPTKYGTNQNQADTRN
jgi:uncharacterized membrane protein YfcA